MHTYLRCWVVGLLALLATSCKVEFDETMPFFCEDDEDCGGDGYVCIHQQNASSYCCSDEDENFNFHNSSQNCGRCGNVCPQGQTCSAGKCT